MLQALWRYRGFILSSVKRDFQQKYQNSLLGTAWAILNPLAMIFVYTIIFSQVMHTRLSGVNQNFAYSIYLCSGLLTWNFFSDIVLRNLNIFLDNANYLKKINFPRICLPVIALLNAFVNFTIVFLIFITFTFFSYSWPGILSFAIIPVLAIQLILALGLGITLGVVNVFFRDVGQFFGIFMQFWFWFTPVVYPTSILPESFKRFISINPMYPLINAYQDIFVTHKSPAWVSLIYPTIVGIALCLIAYNLFRTRSGEIVDEL